MNKGNFTFRVKDVIRETNDAYTYVLDPLQPSFTYLPGQFLTLLFTVHGRDVRRSFSITSSPAFERCPTITIKRLENGELSRYLIDHLAKGAHIESLAPTGKFTVTPASYPRNFVCIAAGSGITPIFSIIKTILYLEPKSTISLLYSNRTEKSTIFYKQLQELEQKFPQQFNCTFLFSEKGERLTNFLLEKIVSDHAIAKNDPAEFYICGPFSFIRMAIFTLTYMGFNKENIHKEHFASEIMEQVHIGFTPPNSSVKHATIIYQDKHYHIEIPPYTTILDAALAQNILLPYSCKAGMCSACSAICKKGKVSMRINNVLTERDLMNGWVLPCTCYPVTDETIIDYTRR